MMGNAQRLRLNTYGSYVLDGTYHIYYENGDSYEGKINHGLQLGAGAEYMLTKNYGVDFSWLQRCTNVLPQEIMDSDNRQAKLKLNYFLLGLNVYPQTKPSRLQFYGGASAGVIVQNAKGSSTPICDNKNHPLTKFSWAARLGGVCWLSDKVGVKLQTQWLSSLQFKDDIVDFDVHRLAMGPVDFSIVNQLEMGTGIIIKLGKQVD